MNAEKTAQKISVTDFEFEAAKPVLRAYNMILDVAIDERDEAIRQELEYAARRLWERIPALWGREVSEEEIGYLRKEALEIYGLDLRSA